MVAIFNGNPSKTIISCYRPTAASDEMDLIIFHKLSSLVCNILKHNVLIISEDMNGQIGRHENNKFRLHNSSNRNGENLAELSLENGLICLNTKSQKRIGKVRKLY